MSSVNSHERVPGSTTGKLSRLTIGTDPVRDTFGTFHGAEISRAPGADDESALLTPSRLTLHADLRCSSPNTQIGEALCG